MFKSDVYMEEGSTKCIDDTTNEKYKFQKYPAGVERGCSFNCVLYCIVLSFVCCSVLCYVVLCCVECYACVALVVLCVAFCIWLGAFGHGNSF